LNVVEQKQITRKCDENVYYILLNTLFLQIFVVTICKITLLF